MPQRRVGLRLSSHDVTVRNRCLCRGGRHRKVGAGGTAVIGQLIHTLIVKLIVTNTIKTKKPTESWALMMLLAEWTGRHPTHINALNYKAFSNNTRIGHSLLMDHTHGQVSHDYKASATACARQALLDSRLVRAAIESLLHRRFRVPVMLPLLRYRLLGQRLHRGSGWRACFRPLFLPVGFPSRRFVGTMRHRVQLARRRSGHCACHGACCRTALMLNGVARAAGFGQARAVAATHPLHHLVRHAMGESKRSAHQGQKQSGPFSL